MDGAYSSFWLLGDNRHYQSDLQEESSWKLAASRLALAEQMRVKFDRPRIDENVYSPEKLTKPLKGRSKQSRVDDMKGDKMNQKLSSGETKLGEKIMNETIQLSALDKRFKSLPPAEILPRNETLGGYIFVCNNDTMAEDLKRQLFGLPQRYRDSVRAIQPGLPLFLYNYTTHQLHGVFEAASFGGSNIDPIAWEDKRSKGESRFPAQVRIRVRRVAKALEEDSFRPVLHHYDGPKFRLQLSIPETLALLDLFSENGAA